MSKPSKSELLSMAAIPVRDVIPDGIYEVPCSTECDRGYGVESAADEVSIEIKDGKVESIWAFGMHFITERDIEWEVDDLTEEEAFRLISEIDPTPWCNGCGAMKRKQCDCGKRADNE